MLTFLYEECAVLLSSSCIDFHDSPVSCENRFTVNVCVNARVYPRISYMSLSAVSRLCFTELAIINPDSRSSRVIALVSLDRACSTGIFLNEQSRLL